MNTGVANDQLATFWGDSQTGDQEVGSQTSELVKLSFREDASLPVWVMMTIIEKVWNIMNKGSITALRQVKATTRQDGSLRPSTICISNYTAKYDQMKQARSTEILLCQVRIDQQNLNSTPSHKKWRKATVPNSPGRLGGKNKNVCNRCHN